MAMGLGAFTEGLSSGIQTRDRMDIAKQYKEKMRQENAQGAIDLQETYDMRLNEWMNNPDNAGQTEQDFLSANPGLQRYTAPKDPALIRFGKWLGKKTGLFNEEAGAASGASFASPGIAEGSMSMVSQGSRTPDQLWQEKQQGPVPQQSALPEDQMPKQTLYADGGRVAGRDRYGRTDDSENYGIPEKEERTFTPRGTKAMEWSAGMGGAGPKMDPNAPPIFDDTRRVANEAYDTMDAIAADMEGASDIEQGDLARQWLVESGRGALGTGAAIVKDVADETGLMSGIRRGLGFFGFDGGGDEAIPTSTEAPASLRQNPEDVGPPAGLGVGEEKKAATDATAPAPRRTDADMADQAIDDGTMMALESLDFRTLTNQGLTPNDLPQMPTAEWTQYRREMMDSLIAKGKDPSEALKITDDMTVGVQMRGFQRYGQQAAQYLMAGLQDEAAMAMSMAFQYFPNGASVQWANFTDPKTGRAALVARGFDEETGEPRGAPQLITADRLTVMMDQFQNPNAFRAWTLDNRQLQLDIAKHKETVASNRTREEISAYNAESMRIGANARMTAATKSGQPKGQDYSDIDRREKMFMEMMSRHVMYDDDIAKSVELQDGLVAAMSRVGVNTGAPPMQVLELVMDAYRRGRKAGGSAEAGLQAARSLVPLSEGG